MTKDQLSQNLPQIIDTIKQNQFDQKNQEKKQILLPQSIQVWQCKVLEKSPAIQNLLKSSVKKLLDSKVQEAVFMKKIVDCYEKDLSENIQQIQNLKENLDRMKKQKNSEKKRQRRRTIAPQFFGQMSLQEHHLKQIKNQQMQMQFLKKQTQVQQTNSRLIFESDNQLLKLQDQNQRVQKGPSSGKSSGVGQVNQESSYNQQNYDSPNGPNQVGVKSSSGFSKTNCASQIQNKQSINSRRNIYNSVIEQDNSAFLSSVSGKGGQEEIIGALTQDKQPNELSSINFQSQIFGSKRSSKNKEQSQKSGLDQTQDQDEYYDSEGDSDSEYYDEEESGSEIGPHNFSKYRITDIRSQSMVDYSVDDSVQGRSFEQLPFQNSICFSPNQDTNKKLNDVNTDSYFIQSNQKNNQAFKNFKNDFFKGSELNYFDNQKYQQTLLNQKQFDNQKIESFLNKQKFSSEIDMQLAFLQQKTEILKAQNESQKILKGQRILGLSRRSDNTKDKNILTRTFQKKYEAKTPKSVSNDLSNLLQFQLRNQNKQQSDHSLQIQISSAKQENNRVTDEIKNNLIIDNSLSCKNSSIGGSPFSKKFHQNFYNNNCDNEADINQHIQNLRKKISDNMVGQQTQQTQQEKISTGSLDNFGNLFEKVALLNIQPKKDLTQQGESNKTQQQFTQELGYETNEEEENKKSTNNKKKTHPNLQEKKQTNFSEASYQQLEQKTLKKIKRDKMMSSEKKRNTLTSNLMKEIPKNELLNPFSLQSNVKKQLKTKQFQQARKQDDDLLKPKTQMTDRSPSNTSSSRLSNASSTFLSKYTISTSSCVSQKKGGKKQINQYVITSLIGQGSFSKVKQVINCDTKEVFAMKIINKAKLKKRILSVNKLNQFNQIEKEVAIMKKMGHPYIVKLVEIIDDPNHHKQYLICEYVPQGSLLKKINFNHFSITENQARKYFRQLCSAVWYCHEVVQIFHRDIKPDNILIDNEDNIKLTDFGVSHSFEDKKRKKASQAKIQEFGANEDDFLKNNAGSDCFFSPEACAGEKYSGKTADIWACAITLYQIVFAKLPFNSINRIGLYEQICKIEPSLNIQDIKLTECVMQNQLIDLLKKMLNKQQKNRLNFSLIEQHPWVTADGTWPCNFKTDVSYVEFGLDITQDDLQKAVTQVEQIKNVQFKRI